MLKDPSLADLGGTGKISYADLKKYYRISIRCLVYSCSVMSFGCRLKKMFLRKKLWKITFLFSVGKLTCFWLWRTAPVRLGVVGVTVMRVGRDQGEQPHAVHWLLDTLEVGVPQNSDINILSLYYSNTIYVPMYLWLKSISSGTDGSIWIIFSY